jgi:hypothetical protein
MVSARAVSEHALRRPTWTEAIMTYAVHSVRYGTSQRLALLAVRRSLYRRVRPDSSVGSI